MPGKQRFSITAAEMVPVLASYTPTRKGKLPDKTHLAYLTCASCDNEIVGSNTVSPFCSCCAGDMTAQDDKTLIVTASEIKDEFKTIGVCEACDTVIAGRKDILVAFDDHSIYCPTCSARVEVQADDDEDEEDSNKEEDNSDEGDMNDTVNEDDSDNLFDNDKNEGGGDSDDTSGESENNDGDNTSESDDNSGDGNSSGASEEDKSGSETSEGTGGTTLNANLVKALAGKSGSISVVASPDKSKWFLFVDNTPVASATKENASDNVKEMFDNDKFATSWNAATSDGVTEDLLNDFGFVANNVDVPVDEAVKQTIEASIEEHRQKFSMTAAEMRERFDRCFGISAVGINKSVFKETNPIKTALIASLKSRRVRDAERIVTAAFDEHGEEYLANISEKASELMDNSDETLDQLAKTVDEAKYTNTDVANDEAPKDKPLKLTTFSEVKEEVIEDRHTPVNHNDDANKEMAASDDNILSKIERMFAGSSRRS